MLSVELDDLIKQIIKTKAESQTVEVKAAHGGTPKRLYDTLSSFSTFCKPMDSICFAIKSAALCSASEPDVRNPSTFSCMEVSVDNVSVRL